MGLLPAGGISNITKTKNIGVAFEQRNAIPDYFAGLTADIKINNDFSFKPELYFERKGWTSKSNNLIIDLASAPNYFTIVDSVLHADKAKLNFIKLPLNISFSLPQVIDGKVSVEFGPYIAYAISGNYSSFYGNNTSTSVYNFSTNITDNNPKTGIQINRFDYGLNFKMGYELSFGLLIQAKYELGLHDVVKDQVIYGASETKFRSFLIGLSYLINK